MNKIVKAMGLIALAAIVVLGVVGCEGFFSLTFIMDGKVVNALAPREQVQYWKGSVSTSATLTGARITLTNKANGDTYTGTVGDGTYTIAGVEPGRYTMTGALSGWSFVPREVDITGYAGHLPDLLAYETPSDLDQILIMVEWQTTSMDVDAYVTRDTSDDGAYNGLQVAGYAGGDVDGKNNTSTYLMHDLPYFDDPEDMVTLERDIMQVGADASIERSVDETLPRVETVRIVGPSADAFETLRYYIRLFNYYDAADPEHSDASVSVGTLTGSGGTSHAESAEATVFVMQGTQSLGTYRIAVNTNEVILGVVQMQWDAAADKWIIGSYSNPGFDSDDYTDLGGVASIAGKAAFPADIQ